MLQCVRPADNRSGYDIPRTFHFMSYVDVVSSAFVILTVNNLKAKLLMGYVSSVIGKKCPRVIRHRQKVPALLLLFFLQE